MESIQGLVEHIVYHNDTNGYTVFSLMCQGEEIVCVGNVTSLDEGEYLKAEGEYNISQAAQHKNGEQRTFLRISAMKSGGRRENEPIFSEKMEENTGFSVFYRQKC